MARYLAKVLTASGVKAVEVEAKDANDARVKVSGSGRVIEVGLDNARRARRMSFGDRQAFMLRLSAMLASGVGAGEALRLLRGAFGGHPREVAHDLLLKVESGMSVAGAIGAVGKKAFPETTAAMVAAGAASGATWKALRNAANFEKEIRQIQKGAVRGIWSALGGFIAAVVFVIGTVFYMLPQLNASGMMQMYGNEGLTGWPLTLSYATGYAMVIMAAGVALLALLATVARKIAPSMADALIMRLPIYRDFILARNNYTALYALSSLVMTGVRMEEAFRLMAENTTKGALRDDFLRGRQAVLKGQPWANAMKTLMATDRAALAASLDRDQVAQSLETIATSHRDNYARRSASIALLLQVVAATFLALSGAIMFVLTVLPLLKVSAQVAA